MAEPTAFRELVDIADGILALLACLFLLAGIPVLVMTWRAVRQAHRDLKRFAQQDITPLVQQLDTTARNLAAVSATVRQNIEDVHGTVRDANERVRALFRTAERRVTELDAVLQVAQDEAENVLLTAVATARGVRAGASVLGDLVGARAGRRGDTHSRRHSSATSSGGRVRDDERTETYDSGEFGDGDERGRESGNGGPRPRVRSRRRDG